MWWRLAPQDVTLWLFPVFPPIPGLQLSQAPLPPFLSEEWNHLLMISKKITVCVMDYLASFDFVLLASFLGVYEHFITGQEGMKSQIAFYS